MQRLHEGDMTGFCLNDGTGEEWEHLCLPVLDENYNPLWPMKHDYDQIMTIKKADNRTFFGQYMQDPRPDEGAIFKEHWFEIVEALPQMKRIVRAWDRAATEKSSKNKDPDFTCGLKLGEDFKGNFYVIDLKREQLGPFDVEQLTLNTARADGVNTRIKLFQDPGSAGVHEIASYVKLLSGFDIEIEKISKDKMTAARPVSSQCQAGNVKILKAKWNKIFIEELISFPDAAHDDIVDTLSSAYNCLMSENVGTFGKGFLQQNQNSFSKIGDLSW